MHKQVAVYGLFFISLIIITGCQTMVYETNPGKGVYSGYLNMQQMRGSFERTETAHYLFWGLVPISRPKIQDIAEEKLQPGQVLANIKIREENSFLDGFLAAITYGLYRPRTITFTGNIYNKEDSQNAK